MPLIRPQNAAGRRQTEFCTRGLDSAESLQHVRVKMVQTVLAVLTEFLVDDVASLVVAARMKAALYAFHE